MGWFLKIRHFQTYSFGFEGPFLCQKFILDRCDMKGLLYCFLIYVLFVSCSENSQTQLSYLPDKTDKLNLTIDTIQVGTPGTIREFPYLYPSFNFSHHVFAGLDERTNSINVYERGSLRITNTIQLNNKG